MFTPQYHISAALLRTLKRIAVLVHDLNKASVGEPLRVALSAQARTQSVYASTTIEGNPLALTAVKALLKRKPERLSQSEQEVINYNRALTELETQTFSERTVLALHDTVMTDLLFKEKRGAYRKEPVFIHDPRTLEVVFLLPDHGDVQGLMDDLYTFVEARRELAPVILAGLFHKQFALVHPFIDGNGRTVRLASTLLLRDLGVDLFSLLSFEDYYNQNVTRYFQYVGGQGDFYEVRDQVDFTPWLEYFAEGIALELGRLEANLARKRAQTLCLREHHILILNHLREHGFMSDRDYAKLVDRAKATRALDFKFLLDAGLIERKGRGPGIYYILTETP